MYKSRNINFKELLFVDDWRIKAYMITKKDTFSSFLTYKKAKENLPTWLMQLNSFDQSHDNIAFLILHEGSEGVFTLVNTWVGSNMLQTHIFITDYNNPEHFRKISGDGLSACVWELIIINHESNSWLNNILKISNNPDFDSYLNDTIKSGYY